MTLVLDGNELLIRSVFIWRKNKKIPVNYFLLLQLFKYIKEFNPDEIYITADGGSSWRKQIYPEYKANRKEFRESFPDINWERVFRDYNKLLNDIQSFTPMYVVRVFSIEGDDVMSYLCRYLHKEVIVVSQDKDIQQLAILPKVKVYSTRQKRFMEGPEVSNIVESKISTGDVSDNIPKAQTVAESIRNQILVDLINLPISVDTKIKEYLDTIKKDKDNYSSFLKIYPYKRIEEVYNNIMKGEKINGSK